MRYMLGALLAALLLAASCGGTTEAIPEHTQPPTTTDGTIPTTTAAVVATAPPTAAPTYPTTTYGDYAYHHHITSTTTLPPTTTAPQPKAHTCASLAKETKIAAGIATTREEGLGSYTVMEEQEPMQLSDGSIVRRFEPVEYTTTTETVRPWGAFVLDGRPLRAGEIICGVKYRGEVECKGTFQVPKCYNESNRIACAFYDVSLTAGSRAKIRTRIYEIIESLESLADRCLTVLRTDYQ